MYSGVMSSTYEEDSVVRTEVIETLQWCLRAFVKRDEANAAIHLSAVRYSPITCSVAESLHSLVEYQPLSYWPEGSRTLIDQVIQSMLFNVSPAVPLAY